MKRGTNVNTEITLLEKRLVIEAYSKAMSEKQCKLSRIRDYHTQITGIDKNGGIA